LRNCWHQCAAKDSREGRDLDVAQLVRNFQKLGGSEIFLNCMNKGGINSGYNIELIKTFKVNVTIPVIASSGWMF